MVEPRTFIVVVVVAAAAVVGRVVVLAVDVLYAIEAYMSESCMNLNADSTQIPEIETTQQQAERLRYRRVRIDSACRIGERKLLFCMMSWFAGTHR